MVEDHPERCILCGQEMDKFALAAPYLCVTCELHLSDEDREQFNHIVASTKPAMVVKCVIFASSMVVLVISMFDYYNLFYDIIWAILLLVALIINIAARQVVKPRFKAFLMGILDKRPKPVDYVETFEKDQRDKALEVDIETVTRVFRKISITQLCEKMHVPMTMADEVETILERMIMSGKIHGTIDVDVINRVIPPAGPSRSQ
jgi:hypothetical protein